MRSISASKRASAAAALPERASACGQRQLIQTLSGMRVAASGDEFATAAARLAVEQPRQRQPVALRIANSGLPRAHALVFAHGGVRACRR